MPADKKIRFFCFIHYKPALLVLELMKIIYKYHVCYSIGFQHIQ